MEGPHIYNTGSIMPVTTTRTGGHTALIFVYHDGPGRNSTGNHRTLHAECLMCELSDGQTSQVCDEGDAATPWFVYHY